MSNFKFTWGHGVMLGLGAFMLFILTLIFLAGDTGDLVTDDYYEESLVFQEESLDAQKRAIALVEKPQLINQANGILLEFPVDVKPVNGQVYLMRGANKSSDVILPIQLNYKNAMLLPAAKLKKGEYDMSLSWKTKDSTSYLIKRTIQWSPPS